MKKYQLWLERKSYSQHLFNLMKIKNANRSSAEKSDTPATRTPNHNQSTLSRYKELEDHHSPDKLGDISYGITFKELKNRKLRLMRSFEILNENMNMARRVKDVKSSFSGNFKSKNNSEHRPNKRRLFEKKC